MLHRSVEVGWARRVGGKLSRAVRTHVAVAIAAETEAGPFLCPFRPGRRVGKADGPFSTLGQAPKKARILIKQVSNLHFSQNRSLKFSLF